MVWCTKRRISLQGMGRGRVDGIGATSGIHFAMGLNRPSRRLDTLYGGAGAKRVPFCGMLEKGCRFKQVGSVYRTGVCGGTRFHLYRCTQGGYHVAVQPVQKAPGYMGADSEGIAVF